MAGLRHPLGRLDTQGPQGPFFAPPPGPWCTRQSVASRWQTWKRLSPACGLTGLEVPALVGFPAVLLAPEALSCPCPCPPPGCSSDSGLPVDPSEQFSTATERLTELWFEF